MADMLATPSDLASALQQDVDTATATLLIECATAVVQEAAGQRIVQVVGDSVTLLGTTDSYLDLPQIPVTAVTSVARDDSDPVTLGSDPKLIGNRLWSSIGWQGNLGYGWRTIQPGGAVLPSYGQSPTLITVVYTHGYAPGDQRLQLARDAVISLAAKAYSSPAPGVQSESIDDYQISYAVSSAAVTSAMDASPYLKAALRKQYGRRGGLVRIG